MKYKRAVEEVGKVITVWRIARPGLEMPWVEIVEFSNGFITDGKLKNVYGIITGFEPFVKNKVRGK